MIIHRLMMIIIIAVLAYMIHYYWGSVFITSGYGANLIYLSKSIDNRWKEQQDRVSFIMKYMANPINITIVMLIGTLVLLGCIIRYCRSHSNIISAYAAKHICSSVFINGRGSKQQHKEDLNWYRMKYATVTVNYNDSSVIGSVFGYSKRKAIFRNGLGATLISELSEEEIRAQKFNLISPTDVNQDDIPWPMGNKIDDDNFPSNINRTLLEDAINNTFMEKDRGTRAVVVVYDGNLIAEQYAPDFSRTSKLLGWSMTKSIINALVGILVEENRLNLDDPAPVPEWKNVKDLRSSITLKHLLQQTSGLNFLEEYRATSDCREMLFQKSDMAAYTASHPLKTKPGSQFYYTSGNTNIISRIIRHTVGEHDYHTFPYRKLFSKLGMNSFLMEVDPSGTFVGSSYAWGTARDWARFGLLYLNEGRYNNEQILSKEWVEQTVTPSDANQGCNYGFQFWLNRSQTHDLSKRPFPDLPTDMFFACGHLGQNVFIIPSKKLVIVRLGLSAADYQPRALVKDVINSIE